MKKKVHYFSYKATNKPMKIEHTMKFKSCNITNLLKQHIMEKKKLIFYEF